ncbi:hypothetical protein BDQ12DRAFT_684793 [Crucibulum laeve]|uniref:Uncharacterized protein n=1 Tax=Crucibulum laeve TaxID=68775 RepID=A0A5C3LW97_9AGAR|nr:hypothetical protein BDQ12DRAFT_684793 [Crucibulum laeve]
MKLKSRSIDDHFFFSQIPFIYIMIYGLSSRVLHVLRTLLPSYPFIFLLLLPLTPTSFHNVRSRWNSVSPLRTPPPMTITIRIAFALLLYTLYSHFCHLFIAVSSNPSSCSTYTMHTASLSSLPIYHPSSIPYRHTLIYTYILQSLFF